MRIVVVHRAAANDAKSAAVWYEAERSGLGIQFLLELDAAIERATNNPLSYECRFKNFRRVLMRRFPYAVYFLVDSEAVRVVAVLHQHIRQAT